MPFLGFFSSFSLKFCFSYEYDVYLCLAFTNGLDAAIFLRVDFSCFIFQSSLQLYLQKKRKKRKIKNGEAFPLSLSLSLISFNYLCWLFSLIPPLNYMQCKIISLVIFSCLKSLLIILARSFFGLPLLFLHLYLQLIQLVTIKHICFFYMFILS